MRKLRGVFRPYVRVGNDDLNPTSLDSECRPKASERDGCRAGDLGSLNRRGMAYASADPPPEVVAAWWTPFEDYQAKERRYSPSTVRNCRRPERTPSVGRATTSGRYPRFAVRVALRPQLGNFHNPL